MTVETEPNDAEYCAYSLCPSCGEVQEDLDGFGVLKCEHCDYCSHASINGNVCGLCEQVVCPMCDVSHTREDSELCSSCLFADIDV